MGMYDYLVDEKYDTQVKLFYSPIFIDEENIEEVYTWHSGGTLSTYRKGSLLPLRTLYYEYPSNFIIVLKPTYDRFEVGVVQDSVFKGFLRNGETLDSVPYCVSDRGEKLNIKTTKELRQYINEYKFVFSYRDVDKIKEFKEKWTEPLSLEQKIGELYHCYLWELEIRKEDDFRDFPEDMKNDLEKIIKRIEEFKDKHPIEFKKFLEKNELEWHETSR